MSFKHCNPLEYAIHLLLSICYAKLKITMPVLSSSPRLSCNLDNLAEMRIQFNKFAYYTKMYKCRGSCGQFPTRLTGFQPVLMNYNQCTFEQFVLVLHVKLQHELLHVTRPQAKFMPTQSTQRFKYVSQQSQNPLTDLWDIGLRRTRAELDQRARKQAQNTVE